MMTGSAKVGNGVAGVIVCTPDPGMLKLMRLIPEVALDVCIAHRSEPSPVSLTVVIVNVAVKAGGPEAPGMKPLSILVLDDCAEPITSSPATDCALVVADAAANPMLNDDQVTTVF